MTFNFDFDSVTGHLTILEGTTEIPQNAFRSRSEIKSVTIADSVTSIGDYAFFTTILPKLLFLILSY